MGPDSESGVEHAWVGGRAGVVLRGESGTVIKGGGWKSEGIECAAGEVFNLDPLKSEAALVQFRAISVHFTPMAEKWAGHRLATSPNPSLVLPSPASEGRDTATPMQRDGDWWHD